MRSDTIVGYQFKGSHYCPDCMKDMARSIVTALGIHIPSHVPADALSQWAYIESVNPEDEASYDSGTYPKVVFADQVHDVCSIDNGYEPGQCGDYCESCENPLGFDCPNGYTGPKGDSDGTQAER